MSQFAPVAPLPVLEKLNDAGVLGNYHLLLAHDVVKHPARYEKLFKRPGMHIIMDNSLIELGHPVDAPTMAEAMAIVDADVGVLPDFLGDYERTVEATLKGYEEYWNAGITSMMAVIQGRNLTETAECIRDVLEGTAGGELIKLWSAPKIAQKNMNSRWPLVDQMIRAECFPIHLLGFSDNLNDDIYCARRPEVMGIDSAVPIRMGLHGQRVSLEHPSHAPRGDYMETATTVNEMALQNLATIRTWFK